MTLPVGISTCAVNVGPLADFGGDPYVIKVEWQPVLDGKPSAGVPKSITWTATGQALASFADRTETTAGGSATLQLPHVDQPGFIDGTGAAFTMWAYRVTVTATSVVPRKTYRKTKVIQVLVGQTTADFDLIADGVASAPVTAPTPTVTSVNGATGAITVPTAGDVTAAITTEATARATADALLQPIATLDASIAPYATGKTTLTPGRSTEELAPSFVASGGDIVTHSSLGMPTIQTMMAFCTDGIIASPLGRFYAYICTDHDSAGTPEPWNGKGGFVLVYANSPTGPWTAHRDGGGNLVIYQDTVVGNQTETPSPLYVPDDPAGKPIYVYYQNQGAGLNQSTVLARSATGLPNDFERVGIVIQGRGTVNPVWPGDGQSTYMQPMRVEGQILAVHLMGGGNWAQYGRSYSPDGRNFITDPRRFGHFSHLVGSDNARRVAIRSIFQWRGNPWAVVTIGAHTSGFLTDPRQLGFARLSTDLRRIVGKVHILADSTINAGTVIESGGKLYMFYRTGDAYSAFRCAIAEA